MFKNPLIKQPIEIPKEIEISKKALPKNPDNFKKAIELAKTMKANDKTKVDIARAIFPLIEAESKEVIHLALIQGCGLTQQGAVTYRYNLLRAKTKGKLV
ncbi:hypothetical protein [Flavobacterium sp.]|jgi:hypothetical protein|uniref:hypothetical protein n=1 Tax=Flavobacterium sp. TaxID=239 RepID=UPI0037C10277